jgi:hypothetical protein
MVFAVESALNVHPEPLAIARLHGKKRENPFQFVEAIVAWDAVHREPPSQGGRVCKTLCVHNNRASSMNDAAA